MNRPLSSVITYYHLCSISSSSSSFLHKTDLTRDKILRQYFYVVGYIPLLLCSDWPNEGIIGIQTSLVSLLIDICVMIDTLTSGLKPSNPDVFKN